MSDLLETTEGGIAWLKLNRPDRLNAFSPAMLEALGEALPRLASDAEVGAIVVTGAGRGFCAGGDVKTMESRATQGFEERVEGLRRMHQLPMLLHTIPKVVIAMVNGPAVGAGLGLALACDLRIAGRSARFGTGFAGVGYSGDFGGSWTLTRLVGTAKARELYFLGDVIDSAAAASLGLVNRVVEERCAASRNDDPRPAHRRWAPRRLRLYETQSVRRGNRTLRRGSGDGGRASGAHRDDGGP
jgi:2-(1,2-epoxy-1,2-dihydrophenyl)acetyl-CoA isomerase